MRRYRTIERQWRASPGKVKVLTWLGLCASLPDRRYGVCRRMMPNLSHAERLKILDKKQLHARSGLDGIPRGLTAPPQDIVH